MSGVEVSVIRDVIVLVTPSGDEQQRFIAHNVTEAHDLVCRILSAVEQAKGWKEGQGMKDVGQPRSVPVTRSPARRKR